MEQERIKTALDRHNRTKKIIFRSAVCIVFLGVICVTNVCTLMYSHYSSNKVVVQWKQPDDVKYDGYAPYYVSIIERELRWNPFAGFYRDYAIYVGRDAGSPGLGHFIDFTFH